MDKEFVDPPQRLKTDVELKVSQTGDKERDEIGPVDPARRSLIDGTFKGESLSLADSAILGSKNSVATVAPGANPVFDKARMNAEKRAQELAFLSEYDAKQVRTRIKLAIIGVFIFFTISSFLSFVFRQSERSSLNIAELQPASLFAALGEGDLAYFQMSRFPWARKNLVPGTNELEQRNKILNQAAVDFEKSGHLAVLTRLGAEEMNIRLGNTDAGLKFGDALIAKYPNLPSNYFWRANIFYDQGNYNEAVKCYEQAAALLKTDSEAKAWVKELQKPIWSCLKAGRFAEADKFIQLFERSGGIAADVKSFKSLAPIIECELIDAPQLKAAGLWTDKLSQAYTKRVDAALAMAKSIPDMREWDADADYTDFVFIDKDDLISRATILKGDYSKLKRDIQSYRYDEHRTKALKAQLALAQNEPQAALDAIGVDPKYDYYQLPFYQADALRQVHRSKEAIATADRSLLAYGTYSKNTSFILKTRLIKAKALLDMGLAEKALAECDAVLKLNPSVIDAHLVKLNCLKALHKSADEIAEGKIISAQLDNFLNGYSLIGKSTR